MGSVTTSASSPPLFTVGIPGGGYSFTLNRDGTNFIHGTQNCGHEWTGGRWRGQSANLNTGNIVDDLCGAHDAGYPRVWNGEITERELDLQFVDGLRNAISSGQLSTEDQKLAEWIVRAMQAKMTGGTFSTAGQLLRDALGVAGSFSLPATIPFRL